uniref:cAMP-dependent protein kinase type II-alpha regulatory subunit n=1 Tax=Sphenodon punctatus TaxID=8508 RepID=A0A8D0GFR7_SPHPU
ASGSPPTSITSLLSGFSFRQLVLIQSPTVPLPPEILARSECSVGSLREREITCTSNCHLVLFCSDSSSFVLQIVHPKTDEQRCRLQEACKNILIFKNIDQEQLSQVLDAMFERKVKPQEHVIDQGDDGDNFYVIERGLYDIFVTRDGQSRCVGRYDNHGSFGELALMYNTPRAATIVATTEGSLWGLDRVTFRRIILKNNARKRKTFELFIESVPLLKSLEVSERMKIVDVIGEKVYQDGERIISQGDKADSFYIVESGEVKILIKSKTLTSKDSNQEVEIARCHKGQYFGELALVTNKPRAASAYAVGEVKCLGKDPSVALLQSTSEPLGALMLLAGETSIPWEVGSSPFTPWEAKKRLPSSLAAEPGFLCWKELCRGVIYESVSCAVSAGGLCVHPLGWAFAGAVALHAFVGRGLTGVPCVRAVMDVQAFERLLGPCMDIMKRNITHYEEQLVALFGSSMDLLDPGN